MSRVRRRRPWFSIIATKILALEERGCYPWTFEAVTLLLMVDEDGERSEPLPFRLDSAAFVSLIPEKWVASKHLRRFLGKLSAPTTFSTAAGQGSGRMAPGVSVLFPMDPEGVFQADFLITPNLNDRKYGLISFGDVVRNFEIETVGKLVLEEDGSPIRAPNLALTPRGS